MEKVVEIDGVKYTPIIDPFNKVDGKIAVIIRSYKSGVFFGLLESSEYTLAGEVVTLKNARRVHYWSGAASLSQMAINGIKNEDDSRVAMEVAWVKIVDVIETLPLTVAALNNLQNQPIWKV